MIPEVARPSRRGVVGATAVGALSGCSGGGSKAPAPRRAPSPGAVATARAAADSLGLLRQYDAVAAAHPALAARLAPLRAEVARHIGAFGGKAPAPAAGPSPAAPARTASPSTSATASATATSMSTRTPQAPAPAETVPPVPAAALSWLAAAERALADRRAAALLALPGDLARLMASVAAAGAGHVVLLSTGANNA